MAYLYHLIPDNMEGDTLYPLNALKEIYPDIYAEQAKKYEGREGIMDQIIPILGCKWNDVLHLSAVNPKDVIEALTKLGRPPIPSRALQIEPAALDPEHTVVYLYRHKTHETRSAPDNWKRYDPADVARYNTLPEETIAHYEEAYTNKSWPFLYHRVPHFLYKGTLNIKEHTIIDI